MEGQRHTQMPLIIGQKVYTSFAGTFLHFRGNLDLEHKYTLLFSIASLFCQLAYFLAFRNVLKSFTATILQQLEPQPLKHSAIKVICLEACSAWQLLRTVKRQATCAENLAKPVGAQHQASFRYVATAKPLEVEKKLPLYRVTPAFPGITH